MFSSFNPVTMVWTGPEQPPIYNPEASFGQIALTVLNLNPTKVIQINGDTGSTMTCAEMRLRAIRGAQNLTSLGYRKGDIVAMACANSENVAPMALAMLITGVTFNPLAPNYGVDDMAHMMEITQPKMVLCDVNNYETVKQATKLAVRKQPVIYVFESELPGVNKAEELLKETGTEQMFFPPYLGDSRKLMSIILCSSGTTGLSKGVSLSHAHLISSYRTPISKSELIFNFSPLYWGTGLLYFLQSITAATTRLITCKAFSPNTFYDLLDKYPIDNILTPPSYVSFLMNHPRAETTNWSTIKAWLVSGSLVTEKIRDSIDSILPNGKSFNGLGISEVGGVATDFGMRKPFAVGRLLPNVSAKIVNEDGNPLPAGARGELLVKVHEMFLGYFDNPEATAASVDESGWFHTGDIAYFDDEGYLYLIDRKKDILKYMGYQISPKDLEEIVIRIEGVEQVCVLGLPADDGVSDLATAVIIKAANSNLTEQDVLKKVHDQVADYKQLRGGVFFVSKFPMTPTGKILRRELKGIILDLSVNKQ